MLSGGNRSKLQAEGGPGLAGSFLREIRINAGAHKDHDAIEFIRSVSAADPDRLTDLACRFMDLLKELGHFSMAVISRTTAIYREGGIIP